MPRARTSLCSCLLVALACAHAPRAETPVPAAASAPAPVPALPAADAAAIAERLLAQLAAGEFERAEEQFAPALRAAVSAAALRATWQKAVGENGARLARAGTVNRPGPAHDVVYVRERFERGFVSFKVVVDRDGAVSGLWYLPLGPATPAEPAAPDAAPVDVAERLAALLRAGAFYSATALFDEKMKASLLPEQIAEVWRTMLAQVGPYSSTLAEQSAPRGDLLEVVIVERHERGDIELRVALDDGPRPVAGLRIAPRQ